MYKIRDYPYVTVQDEMLFPGSICRLELAQETFQEAILVALRSQSKTLAIFSSASAGGTGLDDLSPVGVLALVRSPGEGGPIEAIVMERVRLRDLSQLPHPIAQVELLEPPREGAEEDEEQLDDELRSLALEIFGRSGNPGRRAAVVMDQIEDGQPLALVYFLATVLAIGPEDGLTILGCETIVQAQRQLLDFQKTLLTSLGRGQGSPVLKLSSWPMADLEDDEEDSAVRLRELIEDLELAPDILERVLPELDKLDRFDPVLFEHQDTLGRLEGLLAYPWDLTSQKSTDIKGVEKALDKAVHGHQRAKELLLDLLSFKAAEPQAPTPLVLLCGPNGVGKNSLIRALAKAAGRPLEKIVLPDQAAAEALQGLPRSLPGSTTGAIYEAAVRTGVMDPVLFLQADLTVDDEAARVLMQVTGSELSRRFPEIHLGLPIDTSLMLVVLSVRSPEMVPEFLRRNALVLELEGYSPAERKSLLVDRLWPAALRRCGLTSKPFRLEEPLLSWLVEERAREAGVLELNKLCQQLARRLARRKASGKRAFALTLSTARSCLGDALPALRSGAAVGVVSQVVLVPSGAEVVEAAAFARAETVDNGDLTATAIEVLELALSLGGTWRPGSSLEAVGWHLILPKETLAHDEVVLGFSLALAIRSACLGLAVPRDLAVLGRLGPGAEVRPAGQARERALAAHRAGMRTLLVSPAEGTLLEETLPDEVLAKLRLVPVETLEAAVRAALQPSRRTPTTAAA